jgi:hypothetical protein
MSQRPSGYERIDGEFYPTPAWVTEALIPHLPERVRAVWEPAAGDGAMASVLESAGYRVFASDVTPRAPGIVGGPDWDFTKVAHRHFDFEAIITNPPYGAQGALAVKFITRALALTRPGGVVAMLLNHGFDAAMTRRPIFADHPACAKKLVLNRRIVWFENDGSAQPSKTHCWWIWDWQHDGAPQVAWGPELAQGELEVMA